MTNAASGSMGAGSGMTTQVGITKGNLSPEDLAVLCDALCRCKAIGVFSRDAKLLRQSCVAQRLRAKNLASKVATGKTTSYIPEVSYDMRNEPPTPIMRASDPSTPHPWIPAWIQKYWPGGMDAYKEESKPWIRRPDVVIVNDASLPPVQSNIKKVVEMKFPPDSFSKTQEAAYMDIAGDESKYAGISPDDCGCGDADEEAQRSSAKQSQTDLESILGGGSNARSGSLFPPLIPPSLPPFPAFP
ncbi:VRR-NUC domain-containing protein [Burkholderia sp. MSMB1835]|uniref:VRR-NUC domain-containing protein n=1 Tax=Burkholderia sp. MSMB1835 TaxID=1637876 RepID=UPI0007565CDB|nr:VRR-NUC domain-containing protein [Burkholderia sp. MSMB1835]KVL39769.1 VRR-NUC domain protein [Burkholderia sp. MSMB1835]